MCDTLYDVSVSELWEGLKMLTSVHSGPSRTSDSMVTYWNLTAVLGTKPGMLSVPVAGSRDDELKRW